MNANVIDISDKNDSLSVEGIKIEIRLECENIIDFCTKGQEGITFLKFEKDLW